MSARSEWWDSVRAGIADGTFGTEPAGLTPAEREAHAAWCASIREQAAQNTGGREHRMTELVIPPAPAGARTRRLPGSRPAHLHIRIMGREFAITRDFHDLVARTCARRNEPYNFTMVRETCTDDCQLDRA